MRQNQLAVRLAWVASIACCAALAASLPALGTECAPDEAGAGRILILALDGMPLRVVEAARAQGSFTLWGEPAGVVSTFPSMSSVAFTAIFQQWGLEPIAGYELRRFHIDENRLQTAKRIASAYAWKDVFHFASRTLGAKLSHYSAPQKRVRTLLAKIETALFAGPGPPVLMAHIGATDALSHMRGDPAALQALLNVGQAADRWIEQHRERFGGELTVIILSDHGNTNEKATNIDGLRDTLRSAGFKITKRLDKPHHLVAPTYGAVNYGPLYLDPARAEEAARAAAAHQSVDLAAWRSGTREVTVVSGDVEARVRWRGEGEARTFAYELERGDPLRLRDSVDRLEQADAQGAGGFASQDAWLWASGDSDFPDGPRRLVDSLVGTYVENPATVILSLNPLYVWGQGAVRFGAWMLTGRQEGVHGGLDRVSSMGFLMTNDRNRQPEGIVSADRALASWPNLTKCWQVPARSEPPQELGAHEY